mmetsp:Transcript_42726/g.50050  ORF Transcript_42726/g.50050 Transcript_42726/m.50050 type:complete len:99 (-) Transcript_42726:184-480(-)
MNSLWTLIVIPFVLIILIWLLKNFLRTFKDLVRIERVSFSPIITHLSETLSGITTIRAFQNKTESFMEQNYKNLNRHVNIAYYINAIRRWFAIRLEIT